MNPKVRLRTFLVPALAGFALLAACNAANPTEHELACAGGTFSGAVMGGFVGNQFGNGRGNAVTTAAGAIAGGALGARAAC